MNEVRREPLSESDMAMLELAIQTADSRAMHVLVDDMQRIVASHRALSARVQAVERERDVMSNSREALVEVIRELRQQLAEAQETIIRKDEALGINRQAHGIVRDQLTQAEQQVARLEQLPKAVEKFLNDISAVPPWESAGEIWAQRIMELHASYLATILRETGAGE